MVRELLRVAGERRIILIHYVIVNIATTSTSISSYLSLPHQKRFKQQNGHCYVPRSYKTSKHLALGEWVDRQRRFMRRYDESTNKSSDDTNDSATSGMLAAEERYELLHLIGLKSLGGE